MFLQKLNDGNLSTGKVSNNIVKVGDFVYLSMLTANSKNDEFKVECGEVLDNLRELLKANGLETHHLVKVNVYLTDINQKAVFEELYAQYFDPQFELPALSIMEVSALADNKQIGIDCLAIDTLNLEQQMQGGCGGNCGNCHGDCQ